ncbi:TRAP transporter large permease [Halalkalibacterium halodurans]|uniref:C4-dicarboxylate transport system (Permease large protein) n=2 Tax=Halalkalibacterium halodurans TaxID=86665 RepID=Q9K9H6_HALH5|nr:TRAP transporter large permease [Halalkalibacterium halodurans]MDY7223205.1 TRAP transporter large permease [Halalkalibacterium halodurans]MDY7242426.1 TRAP transporter large permease [Halalkalibacterium halodurans]MED3646287.1 TRAP transporter large permease [Halalkalibacterium halodurans]MED4081459.1 TRAP transporter large permease [Halalkalibacterium halodurans]MED4086965.1 TRAP transporter large permease [Halalkalibacterium halodurans]
MTAAVLFGSFALLLLLSVPIGIALGLATLLAILYSGTIPLEFLAQGLITSVDSFPLMAVPFFILAGEIMARGGVTDRLFNVANALVGNRTGGFAIATVITCMFFAAISGSGPATVAAIGGIMIPAMVKHGYDKRFATALVAAAGSLGVIIPPSIPMVIYGVSASASIGGLFVGGIIPGLMIAGALMAYAYYYSRKKGYKGSTEKTSFKHILQSVWEAKWALVIPFIILGGIYGGVFTPTEAAVVAVVYSLLAGFILYRELTIKQLPRVFADAALTTATILIIVGSATAFGRLLTIEQIPNQVADWMLTISENKIILILLITILLLVVGCFMDTLAAIIILTPILLPIAVTLGYDPIHFGMIMVVNLAIGFITPPLGVNLFVGSGISGISIESLSKAIVPFFLVMVLTLFILVFVPQLTLYLVELRG